MSADTDPSPDHDANADAHEETELQNIDIESLLAKEQTLPFNGVTPPHVGAGYPQDVQASAPRFVADSGDAQLSLKDVVKTLPVASSGELRAVNEFATPDSSSLDLAELRAVDGLDVDALEAATGTSLEELARQAPADQLLPVTDHQDIIDRRRLALRALGFPVKFRWQIPSDSYTIVNPPDAYLPLVGALQQHGADDAFGWAHTRDWGGVVKLTLVLPGFRRELDATRAEDVEASTARRQHAALAAPGGDQSSPQNKEAANSPLVVYGGIQTGYDFRGSQTVWAKPLLYFPASDSVMYGVGTRYSRRHVGDVTDAAHERAHDRVPIMQWWGNILDDLTRLTTTVDDYLIRARAVAIDFTELPYDIPAFYAYLGIPDTYADAATDRVERLAAPATRPTLWNLQLSLLIALDAGYEGSRASDTFQAYNEVAQQLLFQPGKSLQLAAREHDLQAEDDGSGLAPDQQTLSDALGDAFALPGVEATDEGDLSHVDAQRMQETIQQSLSGDG